MANPTLRLKMTVTTVKHCAQADGEKYAEEIGLSAVLSNEAAEQEHANADAGGEVEVSLAALGHLPFVLAWLFVVEKAQPRKVRQGFLAQQADLLARVKGSTCHHRLTCARVVTW